MIGRIPARIFWPGLVVLLLLCSVGWGVATVYLAQSGGGPQVVKAYAKRSQGVESKVAQKKQNQQLGWSVEVVVTTKDSRPKGIRVDVSDEASEPIEDLTAHIAFKRPQLSGVIDESELKETKAGRYVTDYEFDSAGLWDFVITLENEEGTYRKRFRRELTL